MNKTILVIGVGFVMAAGVSFAQHEGMTGHENMKGMGHADGGHPNAAPMGKMKPGTMKKGEMPPKADGTPMKMP